MFRGLPTQSLPLVKVFASPYVFTVPSYQRPYSWTTVEAEQLLEDVLMAAHLTQPDPAMPDYCLGAILLLDNEGVTAGTLMPGETDGPRPFDVVDGQQRLVTLAILIGVLRDLEDQDGPPDDGQPPLADQLDAMIAVAKGVASRAGQSWRLRLPQREQAFLETNVFARHPRPASGPPADAYSAGIQAVQDMFTREVERMRRQDRVRFARYLIEDCHVVVIISRDIDGAHRLFTVMNERGKRLDRKDILKAELLRSLTEPAASEALDFWQEAENTLGADFESFFSHLHQIHGNQNLPIIASMRALVREQGSMPFLENTVAPLCAGLRQLRTFEQGPGIARNSPLYRALVSLTRLGKGAKGDWVPAAMMAMTAAGESPVQQESVVLEIERFAVLLRLLGLSGDKRQRRFSHVISALKEGAQSALASSVFDISRDEQKTICHHLKDVHWRNASLAKHLLMRIEEEISGTVMTVDPADLSVEHVLPLRPAQTSEWRQNFPDGDMREACQGSLGNLALITARQNDRAKNKDFKAKLAIYREAEAGIPTMLTNAAILTASNWRPEDVRTREATMLGIVSKLWRIDVSAAAINTRTATRA